MTSLIRKFSLAMIMGALVSFPALAAEFTLAKVTTDLIKNSAGQEVPAYIKLVTNADGVVTGLKYDATNPNNGAPTSQSWPISALTTGIVPIDTSTTMGKKAVILKSNRFDAKNGGPVTLDYLSSAGITGDSRGQMALEVNRNGGSWELLVNGQSGRRVITSLRFVARRFAGKPIGIAQIIAN
jgi:hypothetical protein